MIRHICIIGAGNVATHLSLSFYKKGLTIDCIHSRSIDKAKKLALQVDSDFTDQADKIPKNSQLYLLCVPDDAIVPVAKSIHKHSNPKAIIAHTSGSASSTTLQRFFSHFGVFYPLQTFSKNRELIISEIPFFITASDTKTEKELAALAKTLSKKIQIISDKQRMVLHVAAVISNNFSNYLFQVSATLLKNNDLDFSNIKPLILETAAKIQDKDPKDMQTGPAIRKDQKTIEHHLDFLKDYPELKELYRFMSQAIQKTSS